MNTMYANASNNTPSYTHISAYVVWRVHPRFATIVELELLSPIQDLYLCICGGGIYQTKLQNLV